METEIYSSERPYDSTWDMYYDEFEDLETDEAETVNA